MSHTDPRNYNLSTFDQTLNSKSRGRATTKMGTSSGDFKKFLNKREKSSHSVSDYQKSRLSIASRSHYGVSGMSGANPGYLGGGKKKDYIKADNFGVRNMLRKSNFPAATTQPVVSKIPIKKE
jgi:hypothetical protein